MLRSEVIQVLLDLFEAPTYLEIGVDEGVTFHSLRAARKIAIDPHFKFDVDAARRDPAHSGCEYHAVTSDTYFGEHRGEDERIDLAFIDGLHTFDQTLKDVLNVIGCIGQSGLIVIDDVIPSSYAASLADLSQAQQFWRIRPHDVGSWMGDVYRLAFFIAQYLPFYAYATVAENHGQMILWRGRRRPPEAAAAGVEAISRVSYAEALLTPQVFNVLPLADILSQIPPR